MLNKWSALFSRIAKRLWRVVSSPIAWTNALITRVSCNSKSAPSSSRPPVFPRSPSISGVQQYIDSLVTSTRSSSSPTTTRRARTSSQSSRRVTPQDDTSSEGSLGQFGWGTPTSETSTCTSQTHQGSTSWLVPEAGPHRPIFYPPPISLLEPTCRPSLIFRTKARSPLAELPPSPVSRPRTILIRLSPLRTERLLGIPITEPMEESV